MVKSSENAHELIQSAAAAAAGVAAGGSLTAIQTDMILSIGKLHGHASISPAAAAAMATNFAKAMTGQSALLALGSRIPLFGTSVNCWAATVITEAIGWAADTHFAKQQKKAA